MIYYTQKNKELVPYLEKKASAEEYAAVGAYLKGVITYRSPAFGDGYAGIPDGYEVVDGVWVVKWVAHQRDVATNSEAAVEARKQDLRELTVEDIGNMSGDDKDALLVDILDVMKSTI